MLMQDSIDLALKMTTGLPTKLILKASAAHPKPEGVTFSYGTAGLRTKAAVLDSVCFRMGLIGALRSKRLQGKVVGLMVTASHNPEEDNGIKAVDSRGEMLEAAWEPFCTQLANASTDDELISVLESIIITFKIDLSIPATVVYGHDTRPSSPHLVKALVDGLVAFGTQLIDAGLKTTPQLHYLVKAHNTKGTPEAYGEPSEEGYYKKISQAYLKLVAGKPSLSPLVVDCANGVGAPALLAITKYIAADALPVRILRTSTGVQGALNNGCGADFVKTNQRLPIGLEKDGIEAGDRLCAFDGDADRLIYFYCNGPPSTKSSFRLLDGDKIASLATDYISELVKKADIDIKVGCVQTAYANGSSTKYLKQRVPVTCTPTGVKYLHHAAEAYDIGVYFEANGHGTVLFSPEAVRTIKAAQASPSSPAAQDALEQLEQLTELINQTVGDAISDMLLVEFILRARQWGPEEWDGAYEDLPNKLLKVNVKDRSAFKTTDAERRLTSPAGLQEKIDELVGKYKGARSFVRPSGTEDCVRVYAETALASDLDSLANGVAKLVQESSGST
ncbi:Phosphoacetylglucosamine mutase [Tilletiaria anomala UBC 951]|uniref:Phosphoacetylglucosamine mutase n=1 Tax=Tilletiaria anomala (strain ATCC 24038 / CBS 436.72 / UBC 951) TaxID=1037660 RepID=A0A066WPR3_TILAU|nr:Phosphoacetylglucosamine mutase [Tilletiaria anomala UBC 951]KDN52984.1 Phosphoacetylglucosamine mutase [Tilletiaria anomala UBC 951]